MKIIKKIDKYIILILLSFLIPVFKQFFFISVLDENNAAVYGFLFAISMVTVGVGSLGTLELAAISSAKNRSVNSKETFVFYSASLVFTAIVSFIVSVFVFLYIDAHLLLFVFYFMSIMSLFILQMTLRYIRSIGFMKWFFKLVALKLLFDLLVICYLFCLSSISLENIFLIDVVSVLLISIIIFRKKTIKLFFLKIKKSFTTILSVIPLHLPKIITFLTVSILSLLIINIDRIVFFELFPSHIYQKFLYLVIILSLFYGVTAFINTLIHREVSKIENQRTLVDAWIKSNIFKYKLILILLPVSILIGVFLFSRIFLPIINFSFIELLLTVLIGCFHLFNIYEKILYISANKLLPVLQFVYLACFIILSFTLTFTELESVLLVYLLLKVAYFLSSYLIYEYY